MTPAIHFEVKKHAVRQTADGWVISFVVHPNDMDSAFAISPLGTRYILAVAQIGDDEQAIPIPSAGSHQPQPAKGTTKADGNGPQPKPSTPAEGTPKTPGERAVIRAAILCGEPRFQIWVAGEDIGEARTANWLRKAIEIESRAEIAKDPDALDRFLQIETEYLLAVGQMAEPR